MAVPRLLFMMMRHKHIALPPAFRFVFSLLKIYNYKFWDPNTLKSITARFILFYFVVVTGHGPFKMTYWAVEPKRIFLVFDFFSMPVNI